MRPYRAGSLRLRTWRHFNRRTNRRFSGRLIFATATGRLNPDAVGWSRAPLHDCNVAGHAPRKKKWNYWAVHDERVFFSATIADVDHYVLAFVYFLEFESQRFIERTAILGPGSIAMPERVRESVVFEQGGRRVGLMDTPRGTRILVEWPDFVEKGVGLTADLLCEQPKKHETLNVVIPWSRERFQFTSKQNTLPAHGNMWWGRKSTGWSGRRRGGCWTTGGGSGSTTQRGTGGR